MKKVYTKERLFNIRDNSVRKINVSTDKKSKVNRKSIDEEVFNRSNSISIKNKFKIRSNSKESKSFSQKNIIDIPPMFSRTQDLKYKAVLKSSKDISVTNGKIQNENCSLLTKGPNYSIKCWKKRSNINNKSSQNFSNNIMHKRLMKGSNMLDYLYGNSKKTTENPFGM